MNIGDNRTASRIQLEWAGGGRNRMHMAAFRHDRVNRQDETTGEHQADHLERNFVFADPRGRRWRNLKALVILTLTISVIAVSAIAGAGVASPWVKQDFDQNVISPRGTDQHLPAVGTGPVQKVLSVHHVDGQVWGTDLETGEWIRRLTEDEAAKIGDAEYVVHKSGYDQADQKTLTITFDDGPDPEVTTLLLDELSAAGVPAAFFVQGRFVARHPEIIDRIVREGHTVGGHTVNHPRMSDLPRWRQQYENVTTERLIRAAAGVTAATWRQPYDDGEDEHGQQAIRALLLGQHLGYTHIGYDFDTTDWAIVPLDGASVDDLPLPDFASERPMTVLMHDAGGPNRQLTVRYLTERLIPAAKQHGYTFTTLQGANSELADANVPTTPTWADKATLLATKALYQWPTSFMQRLFITTILLAFSLGVLNALLALARHLRLRRRVGAEVCEQPVVPVTVLLAAYNEALVIERTIRSVLNSDYPILEVLVVDDGSSDNTAEIVRRIARSQPRVRLLRQANAGKSAALNNGIANLRGEIVVTIDADTLVVPQTVTNLVRRFVHDTTGDLAAVAGVVRVGNRTTNILTRWQALEYVAQIGVDRAAQSMLNAIAIVPGACAAWRQSSLLAVGGFPSDTLAEDSDLAMTMHEFGWRVEQDDEAYAFTEAPVTLDDLLKQRIRWTYGIMQTMWKHRRLLFNVKHPGIGFFVLPNYVLSLLMPLLLLPLTVVMTFVAVHTGGPGLLAASFGLFIVYQFVLTAIAVKLMDEDPRHLLMVPLYRLIFEPLRAYLLYATAFAAIRGERVAWNRVTRTATVDLALDARPAMPPPEWVLAEPAREPAMAGASR